VTSERFYPAKLGYVYVAGKNTPFSAVFAGTKKYKRGID